MAGRRYTDLLPVHIIYDIGELVEYIRNQQEHHKKKSFEEEYRILIQKAGIKIDEKYFP